MESQAKKEIEREIGFNIAKNTKFNTYLDYIESKRMSSHQLAEKLMSLPDLKVVFSHFYINNVEEARQATFDNDYNLIDEGEVVVCLMSDNL